MDQGFAGGNAGAPEVAGDFLMEVHRMEERSRAMQERDEGQSDGSLLIGPATKLSGEAPQKKNHKTPPLFFPDPHTSQSVLLFLKKTQKKEYPSFEFVTPSRATHLSVMPR